MFQSSNASTVLLNSGRHNSEEGRDNKHSIHWSCLTCLWWELGLQEAKWLLQQLGSIVSVFDISFALGAKCLEIHFMHAEKTWMSNSNPNILEEKRITSYIVSQLYDLLFFLVGCIFYHLTWLNLGLCHDERLRKKKVKDCLHDHSEN